MTYYTIFEDGKLFDRTTTDDMNSCEIWPMSGRVWTSRREALACLKNLDKPVYGFGKLTIVVFEV